MSNSKLNYLLYCKNVIEIVNKYYDEGFTTYAAVWRRYVNPIYPMSYQKFIGIINMPNIDKQIAEAKNVAANAVNRRLVYSKRKMPEQNDIFTKQLSLFDYVDKKIKNNNNNK